MIGKLSGRLDWRGGDTVLIDVRGVGYVVHISERTMAAMPGLGEAVSLYTDLLVREDLLPKALVVRSPWVTSAPFRPPRASGQNWRSGLSLN
jgi:hypothetical protein